MDLLLCKKTDLIVQSQKYFGTETPTYIIT